jgi:hypothetical protein
MSCPLGAVDATPRRWHKLSVAIVERREFQHEEDVAFNPESKIMDREKDTCGLVAPPPYTSLKQAVRACSCWPGWSLHHATFASSASGIVSVWDASNAAR